MVAIPIGSVIYGAMRVELFYPYENELRVSVHNGELRLDGETNQPNGELYRGPH